MVSGVRDVSASQAWELTVSGGRVSARVWLSLVKGALLADGEVGG